MRIHILALFPLLAFSQDLFLAPNIGTSASDIQRARSKMPTHSPLAGRDPSEVAEHMNKYLGQGRIKLRPCLEFSREEMKEILKSIWLAKSDELQLIYEQSGDSRASNYQRADDIEKSMLTQQLEEMCAEALMHWAHHLPEARKPHFDQLPLMPTYNAEQHSNKKFTCVTGHNNTEEGWNTSSSTYASGWPTEVTYNATGHGPYPFWLGPVTQNIEDGAPLQVWWSRKQQAEKFYHEVCQIGNAGYQDKNAACFHLMLSGSSYLYTAKEDFCCVSGAHAASQPQYLSAVQFDWFNKMTLEGIADYSGEFYSGKIKNYTMDCSGNPDPHSGDFKSGCGPGSFRIWYYTDLNDRPIEQGEGCQIWPRTSHCNGASYLFHQYNPATWAETSIDPSIFAVPEVCKSTSTQCLYP